MKKDYRWNSKDKAISAALFLTDGKQFLAEIATGRNFGENSLDIPKGHLEKGETCKEGLIREVYEETGLDISKNKKDLIDLGQFFYSKEKDIRFFVLFVDELPPLSLYICSSLFDTKKGYKLPEVKEFRYIDINDAKKYLYKSLAKIFENVYPQIEEILKSDTVKLSELDKIKSEKTLFYHKNLKEELELIFNKNNRS